MAKNGKHRRESKPLKLKKPLIILASVAAVAAIGIGAFTFVQGAGEKPAITSTWAWGNSVAQTADHRGLGQQDMAPEALAAFAVEHKLDTVYLSVPWLGGDPGEIGKWLDASVEALHAEDIKVAALGGDAEWADNPALVNQWITESLATADFDAIQLNVEPWVGEEKPDFGVITPKMLTMLDSARAAAGSTTLGMDIPWWLTKETYEDSTAFDTLVKEVDSVAIVTFSNGAEGDDGTIALATPAVESTIKAGKPFTIGLETETPEIAGGPDFTFFEEGAEALEAESGKIQEAFKDKKGYEGVTIQHLIAWKSLIARG